MRQKKRLRVGFNRPAEELRNSSRNFACDLLDCISHYSNYIEVFGFQCVFSRDLSHFSLRSKKLVLEKYAQVVKTHFINACALRFVSRKSFAFPELNNVPRAFVCSI